MRAAKRDGHPQCCLEWKYILFEFNDSDAELLRVQELADDLGVDSLLFIVTNSKWHSTRFTVDNMQALPLRSKVARVSPSAAMNVTACESGALVPPDHWTPAWGHVDVCAMTAGKVLNVEGWAVDGGGGYADRVELLLDGKSMAIASTSYRRADVPTVHPSIAGAHCGFIFRQPVDPAALPAMVEVRVHGPGGTASLGGLARWQWATHAAKRRTDLPSLVGVHDVRPTLDVTSH